MYFNPFFGEFPKIAANQTRTITVFNNAGDLPTGEYGFLNSYCSDKKCDCRRVMINVVSPSLKPKDHPLAVFSFGWESKSFYRKWSPRMPDEELAWFKGPALDPFHPQSRYSEALLVHFKMLLQDKNYHNRLIRHYVMFKQKIGMKLPKDLRDWWAPMMDCGCESGKVFKLCCGAK